MQPMGKRGDAALRIGVRLGRVALAALMLASLSAATASAVEPDWYPLQVGNRWVYDIHKDYTFSPEKAQIERLFHSGRSENVARPGDKPREVQIHQESVLRYLAGTSIESRTDIDVMRFDDGLLLDASGTPGAIVRYEPPLRLLPTTTVGESWRVGTIRNGGASVELRGEVRGAPQGGADAQACADCLEVRYAGPITGTFRVEGGDAKIESGRFERVVWFRRSVGIVREVATTELELLTPDQQRTKSVEVSTLRLVEHSVEK